MASAAAVFTSLPSPFPYSFSSSGSPFNSFLALISPSSSSSSSSRRDNGLNYSCLSLKSTNFRINPLLRSRTGKRKFTCKAEEYKFPDPIPEFAEAETEKFRTHLQKKLSKKDIFGNSVDEVVGICTEIFSTFLHSEYGGPGTLLVIPFMDMADTLNKRGLPGGPQAARAAVKWAQNHVDKDWKEWTSNASN